MEAALQPRLIGSDIPATIDRYEILQKLASGGMAELFLAKQSGMEGFEKVVVIKRILSHLATDQEFVSMFLDEARIAAKLSHPNVVQIYDLAHADDTHYIVMEYVSGRNVAHIIKKARDAGGNIPVEHVARVMAGVCDGLYYAHTRKDYDGKPLNIIHREFCRWREAGGFWHCQGVHAAGPDARWRAQGQVQLHEPGAGQGGQD